MNIRKKILFRADGNNNIGLGHLYRLFALAEIYKSNYDVIFLTKEDSTLQVIPEGYIVKKIPINITINEEPIWLKKNGCPYDKKMCIRECHKDPIVYEWLCNNLEDQEFE